MSALILVHILEQHGPRLTVAQAAKVLGLSEGTLRNRLSSKQIKLPTYLDGGLRFVDARDLAAYLDECRSSASPA